LLILTELLSITDFNFIKTAQDTFIAADLEGSGDIKFEEFEIVIK
jgi:hypothetical protein